MAVQTLATLRDKIITSVRGRRLGFDHNDFMIGPKGQRQAITVATSDTTGTALPNHGIVEIDNSTNDTYVLSDPSHGGSVTIRSISTAANTITIGGDNATFQSSVSTTGGSCVLLGNASVTLYGQTTGIWGMSARTGSSADAAFGVYITT